MCLNMVAIILHKHTIYSILKHRICPTMFASGSYFKYTAGFCPIMFRSASTIVNQAEFGDDVVTPKETVVRRNVRALSGNFLQKSRVHT